MCITVIRLIDDIPFLSLIIKTRVKHFLPTLGVLLIRDAERSNFQRTSFGAITSRFGLAQHEKSTDLYALNFMLT